MEENVSSMLEAYANEASEIVDTAMAELGIDDITTGIGTFDMMADCKGFFYTLAEKLKPLGYVLIPSNNPKSNDLYLVKDGDQDKITWEGKPDKSFRLSKHWNWRAAQTKCSKTNYIQCYTPDMPWPRKRRDDGRGTRPMIGCAVGFFHDNKYEVVYGEKFNRLTKTWSYVVGDVDNIINKLLYLLFTPKPLTNDEIAEPIAKYVEEDIKEFNAHMSGAGVINEIACKEESNKEEE